MVQHLGLFLTSQDIVRFRTTCTSLYKAYHHLFWRTVNFFEGNRFDRPHSKSIRLLDSRAGVRAFATHLQSIESLTCDAYIVAHYALGLCVLIDTHQYLLQEKSLPSELQFMNESSTRYMQELTTAVQGLIATAVPPGLKLPTRPAWMFTSSLGQPYSNLDSPIIYTANAGLFFPPLTNLTRLECSLNGMQAQGWRSRPCRLPLATLPVTLSLCWMLYLNKGLEHIKVDGIDLTKTTPVRTLAWTLSGLANLKTLDLQSQDPTDDHVGEFLLFHCCQTLESFHFKADIAVPSTIHHVFNLTIEIPRMPMPLLKSLRMPSKPRARFSHELCPVLEHCPALESWHLPTIDYRPRVMDEALNIIKDLRLPLKRLAVDLPRGHDELHGTPGRIIDILEQHTLESFSISLFKEGPNTCLTSKLCRHSATLRDITYDQVTTLLSTTIRDILTNCRALEKLVVRMVNPPVMDGTDWLHVWHETQDSKVWEALGKFYTQIGALHQLEILHLKACVTYNGTGHSFNTDCYNVSLPGMLLMPTPSQTRTSPPSAMEKKRYPVPGFLNLLSGLTKLRELRGSVRMDLPGMVSTMRLDSYRWMGRHWPKLKVAEFLLPGYQEEFVYHLPPHITWLFTERPSLQLSAYKEPMKIEKRKRAPVAF
ncbi:hypothetical protein BGZ95_012087 [Linnemannia exigua]|uniref:Uncharacterized protein n=1 Tax=Linnemannia exigua TaxID=604196 RepID=A0AAD4D908_9FUNG|nr:hypothetical protein BGZ95_012087 [Linnemannia exigua]